MSNGVENVTDTEKAAAGPDVQTILNNAAADPALSTEQVDGAQPVQTVEAAPVVNNAADAKELLEFAHESLAPLYPRAAAIYTPDVRQRLGDRLGALMDKYGLTCGGFIAEWGPEIGLAITVIPLIGKTVAAVREDNAAYETAQGKTKTEAEKSSGQAPVTEKTESTSLHNKA